MIKNQFGDNIKRIGTDNVKNYFNFVINSFCQKEEIIHEPSYIHTPQQKWGCKKEKWTLEQTRVLFQKNVPKTFGGSYT